MKASDFRSVWEDEKNDKETEPPPHSPVNAMISSSPPDANYIPSSPEPFPSHRDDAFLLLSRIGVATSILLSILLLYVSRINRELREVKEELRRLR